MRAFEFLCPFLPPTFSMSLAERRRWYWLCVNFFIEGLSWLYDQVKPVVDVTSLNDFINGELVAPLTFKTGIRLEFWKRNINWCVTNQSQILKFKSNN